MKIYNYIMVLFMGAVLFMSCDDNPEFGLDQSVPGINFRVVPDAASFNLLADDPMITFTTYTESGNIANVNMLVEYLPVGGTLTDRVTFTTLQGSGLTNDGTVQVTARLFDLADLFGVDTDDLAGGDLFTFYNIVTTTEGLVFPDTVKLDGQPFVNIENALITATATTSFTSNISFPISCPSELDGVVVNYEVLEAVDDGGASLGPSTGTLTWMVGSAPFNYTWDTFTFGVYQSAFNCCEQVRGGTALEVSEICGILSISPTDGFGCTWFLEIESLSGSEMTIELTGGPGGCFGNIRIRMTRTDGQPWPDLVS